MVTEDDSPQWQIRVIASAQKDIRKIHKGSAKTDLHTELSDKLGRAPLESCATNNKVVKSFRKMATMPGLPNTGTQGRH